MRMHQPILVHAHVDKRNELRHIRHNALKHHLRPQVRNLAHAVVKGWHHKLVARVTTRFAQLFDNVCERELRAR